MKQCADESDINKWDVLRINPALFGQFAMLPCNSSVLVAFGSTEGCLVQQSKHSMIVNEPQTLWSNKQNSTFRWSYLYYKRFNLGKSTTDLLVILTTFHLLPGEVTSVLTKKHVTCSHIINAVRPGISASSKCSCLLWPYHLLGSGSLMDTRSDASSHQ